MISVTNTIMTVRIIELHNEESPIVAAGTIIPSTPAGGITVDKKYAMVCFCHSNYYIMVYIITQYRKDSVATLE